MSLLPQITLGIGHLLTFVLAVYTAARMGRRGTYVFPARGLRKIVIAIAIGVVVEAATLWLGGWYGR